MEMQQLIAKINELANKQKTVGLSKEEKEEQGSLRQAYLKIFRSNFKSQLDHTKVQTPDGKLYPLKHIPDDDKSAD